MKFFPIHIMIYALLALLPACELIHEDLPETKAEDAPVYIRLTISTGEMGETRATPNGGEDGDGRVPGTGAENVVDKVTLFLFDAAVNINDAQAENTPIDKVITFTKLSDAGDELDRIKQKYTTETVEVSGLTEDSYKVLAVANYSFTTEPATLGSLLNEVVTEFVWTTNTFVMSSEEEATIDGIKSSTKTYPAEVAITIERLAARVDYKVQYLEGETAFSADGGTVQILGATLVNDFRKGEYLFKRVGDKADASTYTYLGDETVNGGNATNWVVDPYDTSEKQAEDYKNYYPTYDPDISDDKDNTTDWVRLGYTLENTNPADAYRDEYTTGVVFKAKFTPASGAAEDGSFYYLNGAFYKDIDAIKATDSRFDHLDENNYERYGITFCKDGICYYTWWILHSNNSDNSDIMRYAIVRNNLYQLTVTSVSAFPAKGDELVIIVAVEEWNSLREVSVPLEKQ